MIFHEGSPSKAIGWFKLSLNFNLESPPFSIMRIFKVYAVIQHSNFGGGLGRSPNPQIKNLEEGKIQAADQNRYEIQQV